MTALYLIPITIVAIGLSSFAVALAHDDSDQGPSQAEAERFPCLSYEEALALRLANDFNVIHGER